MEIRAEHGHLDTLIVSTGESHPSMRPLSILILHNVEDLYCARRSTLDYVFCFQRYSPGNHYLYHRVTLPVTETIRKTPWDVVIFNSTALGIRTFRPRELFTEEKARWSFLRDIAALKVVLPQDDANHGALLDDWFVELRVDILYTVRPEYQRLLYPKTSTRAEVVTTYAGFVDDLSLEELRRFAKPFRERQIDLGQRVTFYPPRGGRLARIKGEAAAIMRHAGLERGLRVDISTRPQDVFFGDAWYRFLGDCKFVPGAEGGLGLWDPYGEIYDQIEHYLNERPDASFEEVEAACFPGLDGKHAFPGFSPRLLEAALCQCCQILVEGDYRGILRPYEHYIPLRRDFSNLDEVFALMQDEEGAQRRILATSERLIDNSEFTYSTFVRKFEKLVRRKLSQRSVESDSAQDFGSLRESHRRQLVEAIADREIGVGFSADALADRVGELTGSQFAEPLIRDRGELETVACKSLVRDFAAARAAQIWSERALAEASETIKTMRPEIQQLRQQLQELQEEPLRQGLRLLGRRWLGMRRS